MAILKCYYDEHERFGAIGDDFNGRYTVDWLVEVDSDLYSPMQVIEEARAVGGSNDPVPGWAVTYSFLGYQDTGSFALNFEARLKDPANPRIWKVRVNYRPPNPGEPTSTITESNPLRRPTEFWIEWIEQQVPIERATCLTDLPSIFRGPTFEETRETEGKPSREPGPVVNATGQQTIDPIVKPVYYPIVCALRNFSTYLGSIYLNDVWQDTMNSENFLGYPPHTWRYMYSAAERAHETRVGTTVIRYYPTITKIEYNRETWDAFVLNNGMTCFKREVTHDDILGDLETGELVQEWVTVTTQRFARFPCQVRVRPGSTTYVDTTEPVNLRLDGTQLPDMSDSADAADQEQATHIQYRYLNTVLQDGVTPADYNTMKYHDPVLGSDISIFT